MKSFWTLSFLIFIVFSPCQANTITGILCPQDFLLWCSDDEDDIVTTGKAVGTGIYATYTTSYTDIDDLTACNEGNIFRTWFVDVNSNNQLDGDEPSCVQLITMEFVDVAFNLSFPPDITLSCGEDENFGEPSWTAGPCDLVAASVETQQTNAIGSGCYHILNEYTVINWCLYHPNDPNWNGEGIWKYIQTIKVIDNDSPIINNCDDLIFSVDENCSADLDLAMSAEDLGACASDQLFWTLSVDLWADNTEDYFYGPDEIGQFKTNSIANNELVNIRIPESVGISKHKISWKVYDYCGNVRACHQSIDVVDDKAPTPYCYRTISSTYWAEDENVEIHVDLFDRGAFDNCSDQVQLSFSSDLNDTLRTIDCNDVGPNQLQVYVTDEYGNQDYCPVNLFIADNGSCYVAINLEGRVLGVDDEAIEGASISLMQDNEEIDLTQSDETGTFLLEEVQAFSDYYIQPSFEIDPMAGVSTLDLVLIQKQILDLYEFETPYQYLAADINNDKNISALDLLELRKVILGIYTDFPNNEKFFFVDPNHEMTNNEVPLDINHYTALTDYDGMMEFVGVKLADVNHSFDYQLNSNENETRSEHQIKLRLEKELIDGVYWTHLYTVESMGIQGFQMRIESDHDILDVQSKQINLQDGFNFNLSAKTLTLLGEKEAYWDSTAPLISFQSGDLSDFWLSPNGFSSEIYESINTAPLNLVIESEVNEENIFEIFPNPSMGKLTIHSSEHEIASISIFSIQGRKVFSKENQEISSSTILNLHELRDGIYFVHIQTKDFTKLQKLYIRSDKP